MPSMQTLGVEEGRVEVSLTDDPRNAILICICYVKKTFGDVDLMFKIEFI